MIKFKSLHNEHVSYVNSEHVAYVNSEHASHASSEHVSYDTSEHVSDFNNSDASETPKIIVLGIKRVLIGPFGPILGQIRSHGFQEAFASPPTSPGARIRPKTDQNAPKSRKSVFFLYISKGFAHCRRPLLVSS